MLLGCAAALLVALPAAAAAAPPDAGKAATGVSLQIQGSKKAALLKKLQISGALANPAPNDNVQVTVSASGRELFSKKVSAKPDGSFALPLVVNACCKYVVIAENGSKRATDSFKVDVPRRLGKGPVTALFNRSLQAQGFHTGTKGRSVAIGTRLAIKAFRKTNGMARSEAYRPAIFRTLLMGKGGFAPQHDEGRHVEVDIGRQVMSLIEGDTPVHTFHVSTGASSTPTVRGKFSFYMKHAGYNAKRMYFSVYFIRGYATHGYNPVPNYPASHGCVRNPIPFSRFIYNWVDIGMPIYVYG
ncbi:MAG TPA: L,D-transpeptidase [Solirubrobacterales bacterium]|nr:L,D-transpeptidase [Solirubrobacterales bacterium]